MTAEGFSAIPGPMVDSAARRAYSVAVYPRFRDRLLLILHKRLGVWLPPGGEIENDELPLDAALRELREETGLSGVPPQVSGIVGTPAGFIGYEEHLAGSKGLHLNFVFVVDVDTDQVVPNDEVVEYRWVTLADGPWDAAPRNVKQLAELAFAAPRGGNL